MTVTKYLDLKSSVIDRGYAPEVDWAANVAECSNALDFACEAIWVVLNAGMREQVARGIWNRLRPALESGQDIAPLFAHRLKVRAINHIWSNRDRLFGEYRESTDKLAYLETMPHIGPITKFHLARNLGMDVCKPDRHLVRIAAPETPIEMCQRIAGETGDRVGCVDAVIWRAANLRMV